MKDIIKYAFMALIIFGVYVLLDYLFVKQIDWEMAVIVTISVTIINITSDKISNKKSK